MVSISCIALVAVLVLLASPLVEVEGYSSGAPSSSCTSNRPGHGRASNLGYILSVNSSNVQPGQGVTVTINRTYQGAKLQALPTSGSSTPVGSFKNLPSGLKTRRCSYPDDTVTQTSSSDKGVSSFEWVAPTSVVGTLQVSISGPILRNEGSYQYVSSPIITVQSNNPAPGTQAPGTSTPVTPAPGNPSPDNSPNNPNNPPNNPQNDSNSNSDSNSDSVSSESDENPRPVRFGNRYSYRNKSRSGK